MKEIECIVLGKVRGVGYRSFVQKKANALWLSGYVENNKDYSVKVVAQGTEEKLKTFVEHLWKGPFTSRVSDVAVRWQEPTEKYNDFSVKY